MATMLHSVTSHAEAERVFARHAGPRTGVVRLGNNTVLVRNGDTYAVRLHYTDIVTFEPTGEVFINTGGWASVTTVERLNHFTPYPHRFNIRKGEVIRTDLRTGATERITNTTRIN